MAAVCTSIYYVYTPQGSVSNERYVYERINSLQYLQRRIINSLSQERVFESLFKPV